MMPYNVFVAMTGFAVAMAFTPGPNNIMVTASGANFGFKRTIPHLLGIAFGFLVLVLACAAGLGLVFAAIPALQLVLKFAGAAYMIWLAWKVANARPANEINDALTRPMTFFQAIAFQWVNPKAVLSALSAVTIYIRPGHEAFDLLVMLGVFVAVTLAATSVWTGFGVALRRMLKAPQHMRIFNAGMALLLVASIVPMVL